MPNFLSPTAGLLALLTLAAPLLLHLWRPPARTVRLGSLRFLRTLTPRQRHPRWREHVLLFTRLALLTVLAALLARTHWRRSASPSAGPPRWALLSPDAASPLAGEALARLRSLRADGFETRRLAPGFPIVAPETPGAPTATAEDDAPPPSDLWSLLREADARLPAGSTLAVFAPGRLAALRGERPTLTQSRVEWIETPDRRGEKIPFRWIEKLVYHPDAQKLRATIATSDAAATHRLPVDLPAAPGLHPLPDSDASLEIRPGAAGSDHFTVRVIPADAAGPPGPWIPARVEDPLRVLVFSDPDRVGDARYLGAAARAATQADGRGLVFTQLPAAATLTADPPVADWTFWLSAAPVPAVVLRSVAERGANLLSETTPPADAAPVDVASWIVAADAAAPVRLWRRVTLPPAADGAQPAAVLWTDGTGASLLTVASVGRGQHWRFGSRFDPAWNELAASTALSAALRAWFSEPTTDDDAPAASAPDRRLVGPRQSRPAEAPAASAPPAGPPPLAEDATDPGIDLHGGFWGLAVLLFGIERALSHRRRPPAEARTTTPTAPT